MRALLGIQIGGGLQDPIRANTPAEQSLLNTAAVPFTDDSVNGRHEWYVWRILLRDFVARQAFKTTTTTLSATADRNGATATARVAASSSGPAPTGTVRFTVDGVAYGHAVRLTGGVASLKLGALQGGSHTVTATYSGDALHAGSQATGRV